jgi:lycopene beta-cyclase
MSGRAAARPGRSYDAVIAGGGLSGLSLAAHLAAGGWRDRSVLLVDGPGSAPPTEAWASWADRPGLLDAAAVREYRRLTIHAGDAELVLPLRRYRYRLVRRAALERVVAGLLSGCPGFERLAGHVDRITAGAGAAEVVVDGRAIRAGWVFDSVTPAPAGPEPDARIAFTGWEVHCEHPVFDPESAVLLDFRARRAGRARFVYALPTGERRALVELTEFVPRHATPAAPTDRAAALAAYLRGVRRSGEFRVLRRESAVLPLRVARAARRRGPVLAIGARGGLIKASTGYAYQRVQRDSAAIAASLDRYGHPFHLPAQHRRHRLLDAVLLDVLERDPAELERAFARLFTANPPERVLRFLDEDTGPADEVRLIASLPPAPYVGALLGRAGRTWPAPRQAPPWPAA